MYDYLINITAENSESMFHQDTIEAVKRALEEVSKSIKTADCGHIRTVWFINEVTDNTMQVRFRAERIIVASAKSRVVRALAGVNPDQLKPLKMNGLSTEEPEEEPKNLANTSGSDVGEE